MYTWMKNSNTDIWNNDIFVSVEECIKDAKENYAVKSGEMIYVGECQDVSIGGIELEDILYSIEEDMYNQVGEVSVSWDIDSTNGAYAHRQPIYDKYNEKLRQLVTEYIKEIGENPTFYNIVNVREVIVD